MVLNAEVVGWFFGGLLPFNIHFLIITKRKTNSCLIKIYYKSRKEIRLCSIG